MSKVSQDIIKKIEEAQLKTDVPAFCCDVFAFCCAKLYADCKYSNFCSQRNCSLLNFDTAFDKVDAVLTPSTPTSAFKMDEKTNDPVSMYLNDIFTVPVNLAGLPAISIPGGHD